MDINLRIAGEAGQGVVSLGEILSGALAASGLHVFTGKSYMSRIRGGLNWTDIRIGSSELFGLRNRIDLLTALTQEALDLLKDDLNPGGIALLDGEAPAEDGLLTLNFSGISKAICGSDLMANTAAAGAVFALLGYNPDSLKNYLSRIFSKKGDDIIAKNCQAALAGYKAAAEKNIKLSAAPAGGVCRYEQLISGADAAGLGAATAGIKLATAYPMTPGTATFNYLAAVSDKYSIVVEQAEDEIAAVNMVCGAVYAGIPAMTMTSGGGFALMCEGLSLAGMMELPLFILLAQRPAPATGMPTRTAQEDLKFALNAGHGEFTRAIYAPGTQQQSYDLTRLAIETAHRCQTPVIMLTDQFLQDAEKNIAPLDDKYNPVDRHLCSNSNPGYKRYALTADGISPRAIPGGDALVVCDSDEHTEEGHLSEDFSVRIAMQKKRMAKAGGLLAEFVHPEFFGTVNAGITLICWGSTYGPCREAVEHLNSEGSTAAMLHFSQVWPLDRKICREFLDKSRRIIVVEGNYTGQFASILREQQIISNHELITRYDGLPFTAEYIVTEVMK